MVKINKKDEVNGINENESESICENWEEFCKSENKILGLLQEKNIKSESKLNLVLKN